MIFKRMVSLLVVVAVLAGIGSMVTAQESAGQPHILTGFYETTNPIYPTIGADTGILLYDLSGLIHEDYNFDPPLESQVMGLLEGDIASGSYTITLPEMPQGVPVDFDGDPATPPAVQVFSTVTYINFLGDMAMDRGEAPLDLSVRLDPLSYAMIGGMVVVWTEQAGEQFSAGLGPDGAAFTADDPLMDLPAGWSVVDLNTEPFTLLRDETVDIPIIESLGALNDYSDLSYLDAWEKLFQRTRETYPFSDEKHVDWDALYDQFTPLIEAAQDNLDFGLVIANFGSSIPDTHIGYGSLALTQKFLIGGIGIGRMVVTDDEQVVIVNVADDTPAAEAGIAPFDVLVAVDGQPALDVLDETPLLFNSASTAHGRRLFQAASMLQGPLGSPVELTWLTPDGTEHTQEFTRVFDVTSILDLYDLSSGPVVEGWMLDSGIGYISVGSFAEDVSAANQMFSDTLQDLVDQGAQGIVLDVRNNGGGLVQLAMAMAGHFFQDYWRLFDLYYADGQGNFAFRGYVEVLPTPVYYDGPVAVLVNEMTGSAADMFAYAMQTNNRALIVGNTPSAGFTGEVSAGQYTLPGDLTIQIPTGRTVAPETGAVLIEGSGVQPDVRVPLTLESLRSPEDEVLQAAESALQLAE